MKKNIIIPLLMAITLLTRLPVTYYLPKEWEKKHQGLSILWYPVVGVLLAVLLYSFFYFLPSETSPTLAAALLVSLWIFLTGALHLDGLADSVDAAFASHRLSSDPDKIEKTLSVFKDPTSGSMAVVALILVVLLKVILLSELIPELTEQLLCILIITLALPRTLALLLIISTPYARSEGLGSALSKYASKQSGIFVIFTVLIILFILLPLTVSILLIALLGLFFFMWRKFWLSRINGFVGDCAGALIELGELLVLLALYFANT